MAPLQPLQQTVFEQGPQTGVPPTAEPAFVYQEGQVTLPEPINPAVAIDPGINWYGLGEQAMGIAQKMLTETWDYLIDTKANNITDITISKEDQLNQIAFEAAELQAKAKSNPYSPIDFQQAAKDLGAKIKGVENEWAKQASEILGEEDYQRFTADKVDFKSLGTKWQRLAMGTKKSKLDLSNQIRKTLTDLAVMNLDFKETKTKVEAFQLGSYKMTQEEMNKVPYAPTLFGSAPISEEYLSAQGFRTSDGKPLMDSNGNPVYVEVVNPQTQKKEYYLNVRPNAFNQGMVPFDFEQLPSNSLKFLAMADSEYFADDRGINIHPKHLELLSSTIMTQVPTRAQYDYWTVAIRKIPPSKLVPALLQGRTAMNAKEVARISMLYALSKTNATWAEAERILSVDPDETYDMFQSLQTMATEMPAVGSDNKVNFSRSGNQQLTQDLISGVNLAGEIYAKRLGLFPKDVPEEFLITTSRLGGVTSYIDPAGSGSVIDDVMSSDPNFKYFVARAVTVARLATQGISDPEKRKEVFDSALKESIDIGLSSAGATPVNGVMVINPNLSGISEMTRPEVFRQAAASVGVDSETVEQIDLMDNTQRTRVGAKAALRMSGMSNVQITDSPEQIREKQLQFIRNAGGGRISETAAGILYDRLIETETTKDAQTVVTKGLSDGVLLQIALASMPDAWESHGFMVPKGTLVYRAGLELPPEKQLEYAQNVFNNTAPAWNWDVDFEMTNSDMLESKEGGLPIQFTGIPLKNPKVVGSTTVTDLVPFMFARNQDIAKTWTPRSVDNLPLLFINNQTTQTQEEPDGSYNNKRLYQKLAEQMADEASFILTQQRPFSSTVQVKTVDSPSFYSNKGIEYPLMMLNQQQYRPSEEDFAYQAFEDPMFALEPIDNAMELAGIINGSIGLTEQYSANDPVLSQRKNNPLENFAQNWRTERGLFSPKNVEKLVEWAQTQTNPDGTPAFVTAADYLSLMGAVTREYVKNSSKGVSLRTYNHKALQQEMSMANKESNPYTAYASDKEFPPFLTQGENKGQILFSATDENLWPVLNQLSQDGFTIVTEMNTQRLYALAPNEPINTDRFIPLNDSVLSQRMANERLGQSIRITPSKSVTPATVIKLQENRSQQRKEAFEKYSNEVRSRRGFFRD